MYYVYKWYLFKYGAMGCARADHESCNTYHIAISDATMGPTMESFGLNNAALVLNSLRSHLFGITETGTS